MLENTTNNPGVDGRQIMYLSPYPGAGGDAARQDDIDLLKLWFILWRRKFFIASFTLLVTLIAVYVSLCILTVTYQSQAVLLQNSSEDSKLNSLSSLVGSLPIPISLPGSDSASLLLVFLQSRDLKMKLIDKYDLLPRLYKDLWDPVKKAWLVDDPKSRPTTVLAIQKEKLKDVYQAGQDEKTQLISISWVDEDPAFAAEMVKRVIAELDYYITHDYVSDAKRERLFVEKQLLNATRELEHWEQQVPSAEITHAKIKREEMAANAVYAELRKQVELARFTEEKEVINFKVIDPPFVPQDNFKPKRALICALALVLGGVIAILSVLTQHWYLQWKRKQDGSLAT